MSALLRRAALGLLAARRAAAFPGLHFPRSATAWGMALALAVSHATAAGIAFADTVERRVAASADDAEETASGSMYLNSSDLELVFDTSNQTVGMRWTSLLIPPGSTVTAAWIQFTAEETRTETTSVVIRGQAADNAAIFGTTNGSVSTRPRTTASVPWIPPAWTQGEAAAAQRTPDLTAVVQEIVGRAGWASGNALALIVTGTGRRNAYSFDGNANAAPLLHVEFTRGASPSAAVAVTQLATPALTVRADGSASAPGSGGAIASYRFDWGDGTAATITTAPTATAQHSYAAAGTYTVSLIVTDTGGNVSPPATASVVVRTNTAPVARLTVSQLATPALTVRADGSTSTDTDHAPIASYRFDFGDGSAPVTTTVPTAVAQRTYAAPGTYTVTLVVTDAGGLASTPATATITVQPDTPPTARLTVTPITSPPLTVVADGSTSTDTGPTPIASYRFTWGDGTAATTTTVPTATAQHTYAAAGTYTVTLVVTDTGGNASAPATAMVTVSPPPAGTTTVEKRVVAGSDDAEQVGTSSVSLTSSDLEMVLDGTNVQTVGLRWTALAIPQGSTITAAYIQFTADESHTEATSLTIAGQAADNAATFTTASGNVSTRPRTTATAAWSPAAWTAGQATFAQRTPDLSAVLQQIVSRPGWASGNALAIIVTGSGRRIARAFEGGANTAPLLHVEYLPAGAPTAQLSVALAASPPYTVNADGSGSTALPGRTLTSYRFDWGDGTAPTTTTAPTAVAQHTYTAPGTYTISLIVTDDTGRTSPPATGSITLLPEGPPTARLAVSQLLNPPLTARADGSASTDPDLSPIASYRFDWGDGTTPTVTTAPTATAEHEYAAAGTYTITLIATDTAGRNSTPATASITIQVNNAPVARLTAGQIPIPYLTLRADASASTDTDHAPIASYRFTWGDGTAATTTTPPTAIVQHTYASPGTYTVTLTATDAAGLVSAPVSANVTIIPDQAPVARLTVTQLVQPDQTVRADGSASTDNTDLTPIASYRFEWGDGTTPTVTTAPTAIAQHTYASAGTYTVTLVCTDLGGKTSSATATIVVVPDGPPTARLTAVQAASPDLTVSADASASTDTDLTPIASYRFDWGDGSTPTTTTPPTVTAQHTYAVAANFPVTLTVTDVVNQTSAPVTVTVPVLGRISAERRVAAATDDAEQRGSSMSLTGGDLEMVVDGSTLQTVGMRWTNIPIPRNTVIQAAWVQFTAASSNSGTTNLTIAGQAADNAATFSTNSNNVSSRPRTSATAAWTPAAWSSGQTGTAQRSPDLAAIIQQIVNRSGWNAGNAIALIVTGSGTRNARSYDGSATQAPLLHIEFLGVGTPPTARLTLLQLAAPARTIRADASASTPGDNPIASYRFNWGDGTAQTTVNAPTNTANHTYAAAGTYTVTLVATDTGGRPSTPVSQTINVTESSSGPISVFAGYYSTHHPDNPRPKPSPWWGSPGIVFAGTPDSPSGGWDTSAIRIDNNTAGPVTVTVTVDVGSNRFSLWGSRTIPFEQSLILAQTGFENFDGSDLNPAGCYDCNPNDCLTKVQSTIPVVNVTMGGVTTRYYDTGQIINTHGVDAAGCPYTGGRNDESEEWQQIFPQAPQASRAPETAEAEVDGAAAPPRRLWLSPALPNPAGRELVMRYEIPKRTEMKMEIYDISGRLVKTHMDGMLEPGEYVSHISLVDVPAGVYYARMWTPERALHQRFVHVE